MWMCFQTAYACCCVWTIFTVVSPTVNSPSLRVFDLLGKFLCELWSGFWRTDFMALTWAKLYWIHFSFATKGCGGCSGVGKGLGPAVFLGLEVMSPARRSRWRNLINFLFRRPLHRQQSLEKIVPRLRQSHFSNFLRKFDFWRQGKIGYNAETCGDIPRYVIRRYYWSNKRHIGCRNKDFFWRFEYQSICDVNVSKQEETGRWCRGRAWADTCQSQSLLFFVTHLTHRRVVIQEETKWQKRR